jgi:hypothetical protein
VQRTPPDRIIAQQRRSAFALHLLDRENERGERDQNLHDTPPFKKETENPMSLSRLSGISRDSYAAG